MSKDISNEISTLNRKDSTAAFKLLFESYYTSLVLFANRVVRDEFAAEDIVQDSLVSLWQSKNFRNITEVMDRYLYRTVKNKSLDYLKTIGREISFSGPAHDKPILNPTPGHNDIEEYAELYRAIEMLPDDRRRIFKLVYMEGYKYQEAADELGISINTVQTQLSRSLRFLREKLNRNTGECDSPSIKKLNHVAISFLLSTFV